MLLGGDYLICWGNQSKPNATHRAHGMGNERRAADGEKSEAKQYFNEDGQVEGIIKCSSQENGLQLNQSGAKMIFLSHFVFDNCLILYLSHSLEGEEDGFCCSVCVPRRMLLAFHLPT